MGRTCSSHRRDENAYKIFVIKPGRKIPLGRTRHRWENNIRRNLK
jgi:hypothetical protein